VVRAAALAGLGAPQDLPAIALPALTPAGTLGRPPLPVAELDARAVSAVRWRQDHLPLNRLRRRADRDSLAHLEWAAAWRLASHLHLDDDQRFSLVRYHTDEVEQRMASARPDLVEPRRSPGPVGASWVGASWVGGFRPGRRRLPRRLRFTIGWGTWFQNRRVGARDRWFRLTTLRYYRRAPQL
jgi:hypothetical protein